MGLPGHGQDGPFLMVVTVTLGYILPEHSQYSHHADSLLSGTVNAVFISIQHTQSVIGGFEPVKARLNKILMDLYLQTVMWHILKTNSKALQHLLQQVICFSAVLLPDWLVILVRGLYKSL